MDIISKRLRELRQNKKLTLRGVAKELNIPASTYYYYENGVRILPCNILVTICKYYSVPSDYILGLTDIY